MAKADENFVQYSKYYDLLYGNKDYILEAKYISECIRRYSPSAISILEFGSGTGIHGLILKELGYDIYGLERSELMVDEAKRRGFPCMLADISSYVLDRRFDVVISLFHVISYITENSSLEKVFKNASRSLQTGGLFIFDVWYTPAVYHQGAVNKIKKVENGETSVVRFAEPTICPNENVVEVKYYIIVKDKKSYKSIEFQEIHPMRHFSIPEIALLAKLSDFEVLKCEEFLSGNQPSLNSWGVNFILKKNG